MIISREAPVTKAIGRITVKGAWVEALLPEKNDVWRSVCKRLLYQWTDRRWCRQFLDRTVAPHRAAELSHQLLRAGFILDVEEEIAQMALDVSYQPESFRNIRRYTLGEYTDWFSITWARNEDLYALATRLPSAHWNGSSVVVSREYYEEVIDFAEAHGFVMSQGANDLAEKARVEAAQMVVVEVPPLPKAVPVNTGRKSLPAPEFVEIDRELMDDEYEHAVA